MWCTLAGLVISSWQLSSYIDEVALWRQSNWLQLNTAKTVVLWCASARLHQLPAVIVPAHSVRDLGIYPDASMTTHDAKSRLGSRGHGTARPPHPLPAVCPERCRMIDVYCATIRSHYTATPLSSPVMGTRPNRFQVGRPTSAQLSSILHCRHTPSCGGPGIEAVAEIIVISCTGSFNDATFNNQWWSVSGCRISRLERSTPWNYGIGVILPIQAWTGSFLYIGQLIIDSDLGVPTLL